MPSPPLTMTPGREWIVKPVGIYLILLVMRPLVMLPFVLAGGCCADQWSWAIHCHFLRLHGWKWLQCFYKSCEVGEAQLLSTLLSARILLQVQLLFVINRFSFFITLTVMHLARSTMWAIYIGLYIFIIGQLYYAVNRPSDMWRGGVSSSEQQPSDCQLDAS